MQKYSDVKQRLEKYKAHFSHLHLIILVLSIGLLVHAAKEVDAVRADQVDGALALLLKVKDF